jgi:hypothetical protein
MTGGIHLEHPQFSRLSGQKTFYREFSWKSVAKSRQLSEVYHYVVEMKDIGSVKISGRPSQMPD